jgi:hypothetical protein
MALLITISLVFAILFYSVTTTQPRYAWMALIVSQFLFLVIYSTPSQPTPPKYA